MVPILRDMATARAFWTPTGSPKLLGNPTLFTLARKAFCTPEQALIRFAQDIGITPLAGNQSKQHMNDGVLVNTLLELDTQPSKKIRYSVGHA
ncbi:hypothetical protein DL93DRAFT_293027 [Clavulina sp. PMI_390]|nr:hypothetical protein DL93DRAFT_293027 [Clavulina sp. PMI_390]